MLTSISMAQVMDPQTAVLHIPNMIRSDEYGYRTTVDGKDVSPLTVIPLNEPFTISKPGGPSFILKRFADGYYACSCPAWKYGTERDKLRKTCPHLKEILGDSYETERIAIAKEAKSTVWESNNFRRATSDSHHARQTHAKSMLDDHFRQLSQSQPEIQASIGGNATAPAPSASNPRKDDADNAVSNSNSDPKPQPRDNDAKGALVDSDTETEEEEVSQAGPSRPAPPLASTSNHAISAPSGSRTRPAYEHSDDENYGLDPDDVQVSPSKRARRGRKSAGDDDDNKVSLLLAKPWLLDADPSKPRSKAMDPTGWWISEKLDGVRAFWDGQRLYSRQKIEWNAPTWWKNRLPKDITLDGELWMSRGTFDQTSQICRTTVRLGRLRTFSHFLERESLERQWLREQVGGRIASQDRLLAERSARSLIHATALARRAAGQVAPASSTQAPAGWKAWKRSISSSVSKSKSKGKRRPRPNSSPASRFAVAAAFLRALFGRTRSSSSGRIPADRQSSHHRQRSSLRRCPRCGKIVTRNRARRSAGPDRSEIVPQEGRANADQLVSESPLPSAIPPFTSISHSKTVAFGSTPSSARRPHPYAMLDTSNRTIPSTYTHVCRRKSKSSTEWNRIKFMIFDSPSMGSRPVEERWAELEKRFGSTDGLDIDKLEGPQITMVKHIKCEGRDHLVDLMKTVESKGGEGLMLRQPGSKYEGRRGNTLFKLKSWYDAEAVVVDYAEGTGRHQGRVGSLVARMACGTTFRVGTGLSDAQRDNPPPRGTIINYRFFELSEDGYPRFPAFRGIARDKSQPKDAVVRPRASALRALEDQEDE